MIDVSPKPLMGRRGLVLGIANEHSLAYGCALGFRTLGADLAITYLDEKAKPYVEPLAKELEAPIFLPCDVMVPGQLDAVFDEMERTWGKIDFALHAIAFAPKEDLHGRLCDCSRDGFLLAMDVSCHSFIRMARLAEPLMRDGVPGMAERTTGTHYFDWHHTEADTFDKVNLDDFRKNLAAMAVMGYVLADMPGRLVSARRGQ